MFGILHPHGEAIGRVAGQHIDAGLAQYGPVIQFGGDDVDGATGLGLARRQHGLVGVQALVLGQQRRVDVEAAALPVGDELCGQQPHVTCERDVGDTGLFQFARHDGVELGAF